jgi:hypothetical protein
MTILRPLDPGDPSKLTDEAIQAVLTSSLPPAAYESRWGLTLKQVFDIQDGRIKPSCYNRDL